jgi:hypothetical protein
MVKRVPKTATARKAAKRTGEDGAAVGAAEGGVGDARTVSTPHSRNRAHHPTSSRFYRFPICQNGNRSRWRA